MKKHVNHINIVFECLNNVVYYVKGTKCTLYSNIAVFLAYCVLSDGILVCPGKIGDTKDWPRPSMICTVQSLLGLCNYFKMFIKGFSKIEFPLNSLIRKAIEFV